MSSPGSKNIPLHISENQNYKPRCLIPEEGRRPSSLNVGMGCGGRERRQAWQHDPGKVDSGFPTRIMLEQGTPDEALFAYGEVVWSWRRDAGAKLLRSKLLRSDGDNKPAHRGERVISRKAIARGMSECFRFTCMLVCAFFAQLAHETAGAARTRHSLRPLRSQRDNEMQNSGTSCCENAQSYLKAVVMAAAMNKPHGSRAVSYWI